MKASIKTKLLSTAIIIAAAQFCNSANATPQVDPSRHASGISGINTSNLNTTVNQNAGTARIYWRTIDTNGNESLTFRQPGSSSVALNYITGGSPTNFGGRLDANGRVAVINPYGVTFAAGSQVNVAALMATTAKTVTPFGTTNGSESLAGGDITVPVGNQYYLVQGFDSNAAVNLNGTINAKNYVSAYANQIGVGKDAHINVNPGGNVNLQSGSNRYGVALDSQSGTVNSLSKAKSSNIAVNGAINTTGGVVNMYARGSDLANTAINLKGVVDVSNINDLTGGTLSAHPNAGRVRLASDGNTLISGTVNASGHNANNSVYHGYITASAGQDLISTGNLTSASDNGNNKIVLTAGRDANLSGNYNASGAANSTFSVNAKRNVGINGGVQVGNGAATVTSGGTTTIYNAGYINAQGNNANAQSVLVPSNNGGNITINSKGDALINGYVDAGSLQGPAGNVRISSTAGNLTTNTKIAGNNITLHAAKDLNINNPHGDDYIAAYNGGYKTGAATGGTITLTSGGNTKSGGNINSTSKGVTTINAPIVTSSSGGKAGNAYFRGQQVIKTGNASYNTTGGTADGKVYVNGVAQ